MYCGLPVRTASALDHLAWFISLHWIQASVKYICDVITSKRHTFIVMIITYRLKLQKHTVGRVLSNTQLVSRLLLQEFDLSFRIPKCSSVKGWRKSRLFTESVNSSPYWQQQAWANWFRYTPSHSISHISVLILFRYIYSHHISQVQILILFYRIRPYTSSNFHSHVSRFQF